MNKILELKKKIHAFKNGIKYINMTQNVKDEALSSILKSSNKKEQKCFAFLNEEEIMKTETK